MQGRVSHFSKKFEFHLPNPGSHSILYLKEESKFSEFSDFVYYSKISWQNGSDPFKGEQKKYSDYRVHGIQINQLNLTVSMQKSVLKNMHRVLKYWQKFLLFIVLFLLFINELPDIVNDVTDDRVNNKEHKEATDKEDTKEVTDNIIIKLNFL